MDKSNKRRNIKKSKIVYKLFQGPVIAIVIVGSYIFTKSIFPSGEKTAPANSDLLNNS